MKYYVSAVIEAKEDSYAEKIEMLVNAKDIREAMQIVEKKYSNFNIEFDQVYRTAEDAMI